MDYFTGRLQVSKEKVEEIETMFFGPYKDEWRDFNGIVDNTDETIAMRVGLAVGTTSHVISRLCKKHWNKVTKLRNTENYVIDAQERVHSELTRSKLEISDDSDTYCIP